MFNYYFGGIKTGWHVVSCYYTRTTVCICIHNIRYVRMYSTTSARFLTPHINRRFVYVLPSLCVCACVCVYVYMCVIMKWSVKVSDLYKFTVGYVMVRWWEGRQESVCLSRRRRRRRRWRRRLAPSSPLLNRSFSLTVVIIVVPLYTPLLLRRDDDNPNNWKKKNTNVNIIIKIVFLYVLVQHNVGSSREKKPFMSHVLTRVRYYHIVAVLYVYTLCYMYNIHSACIRT
jgi:hypothetical protein